MMKTKTEKDKTVQNSEDTHEKLCFHWFHVSDIYIKELLIHITTSESHLN